MSIGNTAKRGQAVLGRRGGDVDPLGAGLDAGAPPVDVDLDAAHSLGAHDHRVGDVAERGGVVSGALSVDPQAVLAGVAHDRGHVLRARGVRDGGGPQVGGKRKARAGLVVAVVAR